VDDQHVQTVSENDFLNNIIKLLTYRRTAALLSTDLTCGLNLLYGKKPWVRYESR
jgi:hypothetical protein